MLEGGTTWAADHLRDGRSEHGSAKTAAELVAIAEGNGRPARQRTTTPCLRPPPGDDAGLCGPLRQSGLASATMPVADAAR